MTADGAFFVVVASLKVPLQRYLSVSISTLVIDPSEEVLPVVGFLRIDEQARSRETQQRLRPM